jgi:hypothetical protein
MIKLKILLQGRLKKESGKLPKTSPAPSSGYGFCAVINIKPFAEASTAAAIDQPG